MLDPKYTAGYVSKMLEALRLEESKAYVIKEKLVLYQEKATAKKVAGWVATEIGSILNIKKLYMQALHVEYHMGAALGFQPFDLQWWAAKGDDETLKKTFTPLANAFRCDVDKLVE